MHQDCQFHPIEYSPRYLCGSPSDPPSKCLVWPQPSLMSGMVTLPTQMDPKRYICSADATRGIWTGLLLTWQGFLGKAGWDPKHVQKWLERDWFSFHCDKQAALGRGVLCIQNCLCALWYQREEHGAFPLACQMWAEEERGLTGVAGKSSAVKHQEWSQTLHYNVCLLVFFHCFIFPHISY